MIDDESAAQIQAFTSWAVSKGYHVVGALIAKSPKPTVRIFASGPEGDALKQEEHVVRLVDIVHYTIHKGKRNGESAVLPLGTN